MARSVKLRRLWLLIAVAALILGILAPAAVADDHPDPDGPDDGHHDLLELPDFSEALAEHDATTAAIAEVISSGPTAKNVKNLDLRGRGDRSGPDETTDVWVLGNYAYTGTFNNPCGGDPEAGIWVWDVRNANNAKKVGVIPSETGDRTNDVRVAEMNSGDILVMSNEACGPAGDGGFEVYNVDDPKNPVKLASVTISESDLNVISPLFFVPGSLDDVGVHNLWLFSQGDKDYVSAVSEGAFDNFRIYDITDPSNPTLVSGWGAEELVPGLPAGVDDYSDLTLATDPGGAITLNALLDLFSGFGASQNKFLHDVTMNADGTHAYLANWDAGLVLLDISDPANPSVVSVALDPVNGSLDGEVNSHSVWPSEDGSIVVEGEEDFSAWETLAPPSNLTLDSSFPGDPTIPATATSTVAGNDFEANQTGEVGTVDGSSVVVNTGNLAGNSYPAIELSTAAGSPTFGTTGPLTGELVWIGRGCTTTTSDTVLNAGAIDPGDIAVVRRGACFFEEKAAAAASAGASAVILANNVSTATPWSGLRIWDYSDPADPVLASLFDTTCSASTAPSTACRAEGTYSSHNVIVETRGNKVMAYVSWYWDGMLVIDVTDPYNPVEIGRYLDTEEAGGFNDFWGVYKVPNDPFIYASDRSGGLYIFKEQGSGSR